MFNFDEVMQVFSEELRKAEIAFADVSSESEVQKWKALMTEISKPFGKIPTSLRKELGLDETTTRSEILESIQRKLDSLGQEQKVEERVKESTGIEPSDLALKYKDKLKKEYEGYQSKDKKKLIDEYQMALKMPAKTEEQIRVRDEMLSEGKDTFDAYRVAKKAYEDWTAKTPREQNKIANLRETDRLIEEQKKKIPAQNKADLDKARAALAVIDQKIGRLPEGSAKEELKNTQKVRREALASYEKDYTSNPVSPIGALNSFLADVVAESQRATKDMSREDLLDNYAVKKEMALQDVLETLATSERDSDKQLYTQVKEQIGRKPTEDASAYMSRLGSLMGSVAIPAMRIKQLADVTVKSELDGLKEKDLKKRLEELKPIDRIDYMLERVGIPGESKQAPRTYIKDELEKLYGKEVSEVLGSPLFLDKNVDKPGFLTTINKLEKARQQLDESDWKDSKHKESILLEVAANPMSSEKVVAKYKDFKPESDAKASEYFDKMKKITQSKMDLDTLQNKYAVEAAEKKGVVSEALIRQIADKKAEMEEQKKNIYGDTAQLDEIGSKLKTTGLDLEKAKSALAKMQRDEEPLSKINAIKKQIFRLEKDQKDLYKKIEPLVGKILEQQKDIPISDRNQYAKVVLDLQAKKAEDLKKGQQIQKDISKQKVTEELEQQKIDNKPMVARLKETWMNKLKNQPESVQVKIKAKLDTIGDLTNEDYLKTQRELETMTKEVAPQQVEAKVESVPSLENIGSKISGGGVDYVSLAKKASLDKTPEELAKLYMTKENEVAEQQKRKIELEKKLYAYPETSPERNQILEEIQNLDREMYIGNVVLKEILGRAKGTQEPKQVVVESTPAEPTEEETVPQATETLSPEQNLQETQQVTQQIVDLSNERVSLLEELKLAEGNRKQEIENRLSEIDGLISKIQQKVQ